ncbi:unnamed protein product [Periconia digitata]|uniref:Uncharacterized protein n=1 Tax=Periconia digitata TaxID=1303443 RepID=A0A9W4XQU4_9PLEO|nr:unnamed protein product [Periconia digitata]
MVNIAGRSRDFSTIGVCVRFQRGVVCLSWVSLLCPTGAGRRRKWRVGDWPKQARAPAAWSYSVHLLCSEQGVPAGCARQVHVSSASPRAPEDPLSSPWGQGGATLVLPTHPASNIRLLSLACCCAVVRCSLFLRSLRRLALARSFVQSMSPLASMCLPCTVHDSSTRTCVYLMYTVVHMHLRKINGADCTSRHLPWLHCSGCDATTRAPAPLLVRLTFDVHHHLCLWCHFDRRLFHAHNATPSLGPYYGVLSATAAMERCKLSRTRSKA